MPFTVSLFAVHKSTSLPLNAVHFFPVHWVRPLPVLADQDAKMRSLHRGVGSSTVTRTTGGHVGVRSLTYMLTSRFYWPRMKDKIKEYVASCHECQMKKTRKIEKSAQELHNIPVPSHPWYQLGMDLMFLKPVAGYVGILTVTDYFTKWCEIAPIRQKSGIEIAYHLFVMMLRHGALKSSSVTKAESLSTLSQENCSV